MADEWTQAHRLHKQDRDNGYDACWRNYACPLCTIEAENITVTLTRTQLGDLLYKLQYPYSEMDLDDVEAILTDTIYGHDTLYGPR